MHFPNHLPVQVTVEHIHVSVTKKPFSQSTIARSSDEYKALQKQFANDTHVQAVLSVINALDPRDLEQAYRGTGSCPYPPQLLLVWLSIGFSMVAPAQSLAQGYTEFGCLQIPWSRNLFGSFKLV